MGLLMGGTGSGTSILILGAPCSGTSVLTSSLALCGISEPVLDPTAHREVRALCHTLLRAADSEWWRLTDFRPEAVPEEASRTARAELTRIAARLDTRAPWVLSEPGLCLLLPLLAPVLRPVCLHMHSDPLETARALQARHDLSVAEGLSLWEVYTRSALAVSEGLPRVALLRDDLLARPAATLSRLTGELANLGVGGLVRPGPTNAAQADPRSPDGGDAAKKEGSRAYFSPSQARLWDALQAGRWPAREELSPAAQQSLRDLDARKSARRALAAEIQALSKLKLQLDQRLHETGSALSLARKENAALLGSMSWRITKPMRSAAGLARRIRRNLSRRVRRAIAKAARTARGRLAPAAGILRQGRDVLDRRAIRASGLFDPAWYLAKYPDALGAREDPLGYFLRSGWREGHNPSGAFDTLGYLMSHPAVARARINPLVDYVREGRKHGRPIQKPASRSWTGARDPLVADPERGNPCLGSHNPDLVSVIVCIHGPMGEDEEPLRSLFNHEAGQEFELVLVDCGADAVTKALMADWRRREPVIQVIDAGPDAPFPLGANIGFAASCGAIAVFLGEDVEVSPEWLRPLVHALNDSGVLGAQPKVLNPDGTIRSFGLNFSGNAPLPHLLFSGQPGALEAASRPRTTTAVSAACAAFHSKDFDRLRGFRSLTPEEAAADFCMRLGKGAPVFRVVPAATVLQRPLLTEPDRRARAGSGIQPAPLAAPFTQSGQGDGMILLKIGCPRPEMKDRWGDYHFAVALAAAFLRQGCRARIDFARNNPPRARTDDVTLVLRGRHRFDPGPGALNLMWLISHPDRVTPEELRLFDHVFIASQIWADRIAEAGGVSCEALLQCTDNTRFHPGLHDPHLRSPALFVANSRKVLRRVVREAVEQDLPIDIYGEMWEGLAPAEWVKGETIANVDLPRHYASADLVLNDHWDSMRENGFVSNRVFDVLATGAPLVTDHVIGMPDDIAEACHFFGDGTTLTEAVAAAHADRGAQDGGTRVLSAHARAVAETICRDHSFDARAERILAVIRRPPGCRRHPTRGRIRQT